MELKIGLVNDLQEELTRTYEAQLAGSKNTMWTDSKTESIILINLQCWNKITSRFGAIGP